MKEKKIKKVKIGFVGGGNMAVALIAALLRGKIFSASQIGVHEPDPKRARALKNRFKPVSFDSNRRLVESSDTVLLAVKPQQMAAVLEEIRLVVTQRHLIVSIAAGLDTGYFKKRLAREIRIVRAMPNMAAMIGEGATGLFAATSATRSDRALALKIFSAAGKALFVEREEMLDVVTAVSGSGPAFVYDFAGAIVSAAERLGLGRDLGLSLLAQTLIGAGRMLETSTIPLPDMIRAVASKGGTTEAGLKALADGGFRQIVGRAIEAATEKAKELRCIS